MLGTIEDRRSVMANVKDGGPAFPRMTTLGPPEVNDVALPRGSTVAESATVSPNQVSTLPWRVEPGAFVYVVDSRGDVVGIIDTDDQAELIVKCVNSYPALVEALTDMLDRYLSLVNCGDCGHWDPEAEPHVIAARVVLAGATHG